MVLLRKDYKGALLCEPCTNLHHDRRATGSERSMGHAKQTLKGGIPLPVREGVISNCLRGGCQCSCVELARERHPRKVKDRSAQTKIDTAGSDLTITAKS